MFLLHSVFLPRPRHIREWGIVFDRCLCLYVCIYLCFFVSKIMRKRPDQFTWNFQKGAEWPRYDLIQFWVSSEKPCDAAMLISFSSFVNVTSKRLDLFAWNFQGKCGVTMGRPDYIFGQFRETVYAQHRDGVCCALAPQLVIFYTQFTYLINQLVRRDIMQSVFAGIQWS